MIGVAFLLCCCHVIHLGDGFIKIGDRELEETYSRAPAHQIPDIDVLVKHDEIEGSSASLRSIGYGMLGEPSGHAHAYTFHRPMSLVTIDLHRDVGPQRALLSPEAVYAAARPINRNDASMDGLAISHRVLMLIMTFGIFERHYLSGHIPMRGLVHLADLRGVPATS